MKKFMNAFAILALVLPSALLAEKNMPKLPPMPQTFSKLTTLAGHWEGTSNEGDGKEIVKVSYKTTSNGSVVVETLAEGTDHEMVSIYHREGDTLGMTHYCALGNQPHMKLMKAANSSLAFAMEGTQGISAATEPHMHSLALSWADNNHMKQEWGFYDNGKLVRTTVFNFTRLKDKK